VVKPLSRKLLRDLWRQKTQVATIALVVASGIGGFIGSISAHRSLAELRDSYYDQARFAHVFAAARRVPEVMADRVRSIPGVVDAQLSVAGATVISIPGNRDAMTGLLLSLPDAASQGVNRVTLRRGRWVSEFDHDGVLLSEAFADARGLRPGDRFSLLMNGRYQRVTVTGIALSPAYIFAASRGGFSDDTTFAVIWMPRERLAAAYDMQGAFNDIAIRLQRGANERAVITELDRLLASYGSTGAYLRDNQTSHRSLTQEINEQRVFGTVLPSIFLAVAVFLLQVLLSRHINTERLQIAALKALGYRNATIGWHYLGLALATAVLGIFAGLVLGVWLGRWMTDLYTTFFRFPVVRYRLEAWIAIAACLLALAAAFGAAISAVRRVVQLPAAEALRPATPTHYRRTLLERANLMRLLPAEARMIVREIERRPLRTLLTTLGVASSVAIIVAGTWWTDAFNYLVDLELYRRDRAQILLATNQALNKSALNELARLPGTLAVEGSRSVPAVLGHLQFSYRTAISGLDPEAKQRLLLDPQGSTLTIPTDAILLTDRLAKVLHVTPGDFIFVSVLEGARREAQLRVAGLTGDLMGMQAYMDRRTLTRLAGDGDTFNLARLRIDAGRHQDFIDTIRLLPQVASAGDKDRLVRQFRATSQRNFLYFAAILSTLAACIAIGVVYNSARITLAEHATELATLRVIGFTRAEVSWILLGLLSAQIAAAVPLGWLSGYWLSRFMVQLMAAPDFRIPLVVSSSTYATATVVMLGAGIVSALVVRQRIDHLDLIGVLKTRE
jgi:putative ABC transport system permease protein